MPQCSFTSNFARSCDLSTGYFLPDVVRLIMSTIISALLRVSSRCVHGKLSLDRASSVTRLGSCLDVHSSGIHFGAPLREENIQEDGASAKSTNLQFCIVGSGPSGFYTASQVKELLLRQKQCLADKSGMQHKEVVHFYYGRDENFLLTSVRLLAPMHLQIHMQFNKYPICMTATSLNLEHLR